LEPFEHRSRPDRIADGERLLREYLRYQHLLGHAEPGGHGHPDRDRDGPNANTEGPLAAGDYAFKAT
jgi:hypothetical protein